MIKITAEEIEIVVTASVEDALREFKRMLPEVKKQIQQVQDQFNKVDMKGIANKTQVAVSAVKQKINQIKGTNVDKTLQSQFDKAGASVEKYQQQLEQTKEKLRQVYAQMDEKQQNIWNQYTPDGIDINKNPKSAEAIEPLVNNALGKDKIYQNLIAQEEKLNQKVQELNQKLQEARGNYSNLGAEIQKTQSKQNIFTNLVSKLKVALNGAKQPIASLKNSFNKLPNITAKVNANIKQMSSGVKQGLGHILKYAGALFSLRGIYSILSSSASSWLSSQNAGAQQLQTNINYMKYALGSALAPVIQYVTNLVYNLLKAIQSVVYALFRVNIFAKASAKSYGAMASGAKKAKEESKQLAGVHDEINNIQDNNSSSGSGSGDAGMPNFDLSNVNSTSSIMDAISNGDWYGVGVLLGEKLNQAMASIPWDKIQNTARQIGRNIANLLNGFIATTDWYQVGNTLAQGLNTVIYFAYEFITTFDWKQFGSSIATSINSFFANVNWGKLAQTLSEGIKGVFETVTGFFTTLDWGVIIDSIVTFFQNVDYSGISDAFFEMMGSAAASLVNLGMVIGDYIGQAIQNIKDYFSKYIEYEKEIGGNIIAGILDGIIDALINIGGWVIDHIFKPFIEGFKNAFGIHSPSTVMSEQGRYIIEGLLNGIKSLVDKVKDIWKNMKETAITIFNNLKDKLSEIWNNIKTTATTLFTNMKNTVIEKFTNIKTKAQEIWNNIKTTITDKITNVKTNLSNTLNNIKTFWSNIWTGMKDTVTNIFNNIWSSIKGVINSILGGIESMANGIVNGVNKVIDVLNNLKFNIPDWVPGMGGKTFGFNINHMGTVSLPRLAKGNVAYDETLAIFGEYAGASNNPEITTPQNIMEETFERVLSRNNGNNQPIYLTVNVSNKKLGSILLEDLRSMKRQTGKDIEAIVGG